jgi:hypothetical protein
MYRWYVRVRSRLTQESAHGRAPAAPPDAPDPSMQRQHRTQHPQSTNDGLNTISMQRQHRTQHPQSTNDGLNTIFMQRQHRTQHPQPTNDGLNTISMQRQHRTQHPQLTNDGFNTIQTRCDWFTTHQRKLEPFVPYRRCKPLAILPCVPSGMLWPNSTLRHAHEGSRWASTASRQSGLTLQRQSNGPTRGKQFYRDKKNPP